MILTYPNGQEVDIFFDETQHNYCVAHKMADGTFSDYRPTHGATAPLATVPKEFLKPWIAKLTAEALMSGLAKSPLLPEQYTEFLEDKQAMDENWRTEDNKPVMSNYRFNKKYPFFSTAKTAYKDASKAGADSGTWIHKAIETYYKTNRKKLPIITEDVQGMWDSFLMFDSLYKPTPDKDGLEFFVYSLLFGYSGQGDFKGVLAGKRMIVDWKSTNRSRSNTDGISVDYFFQLGGLAQAEYERTGVWVDDVAAVNLSKDGEDPIIRRGSDFGASPQDLAKAYIACFNNYHSIREWDYRYKLNT